MRLKKSEISTRVKNNLKFNFIRKDMTSVSGLEVIKRFLMIIDLNKHMIKKLKTLNNNGDYPGHKKLLLIIGLILIGVERLSNVKYFSDDPILKRFCELKKIPSRHTLVRFLDNMTEESLKSIEDLNLELLTNHINHLGLSTLTIDIDGTVLSSRGKPELSEKGYNNIKRGAYSYFPITAYLAQTGHFLKIKNRSGNVHDSNGSTKFIQSLVDDLKFHSNKKLRIQIRHDSGFFDEKRFKMYESNNIEYAAKVPFWRYPIFKQKIVAQKKWNTIDKTTTYFFKKMKLDNWEDERFFLFIRREKPKKKKQKNYQLDLFEPEDCSYEYSAICTNMTYTAKNLNSFMLGRSAQEKAIAELKNEFSFDKIPAKSYNANSSFMQLSMISYNLMTSFQLEALGWNKTFKRNVKRTRMFKNQSFKTIRFLLVLKAGILNRTNGRKQLNLSQNDATQKLYQEINDNLQQFAQNF